MLKRILPVLFVLIIVSIFVLHRNQPVIFGSKVKKDISTSQGLNADFAEQKKIRKTRPKFDKPDKAMEEEVALRSEIGKPFAYKQGWRIEAAETARASRGYSLLKASAIEWVERGPGNVGGRTRAIVVDPTDEDVWLVGAVGGGIWKTNDAGATWRCVSDDLPVLSVCAMDICLSNPDVLYAGTGEGFYNSDAIPGDGLFKSIDRGETWTEVGSTTSNNNFRYVNRIIVDPADADIVLVATNSGLFRSEDGGMNWATVFSNGNRVQQIIANPLRFNTQFIAVNSSGIYKSTDGGITWNYESEEIQGHGRIEIAIAEADTNILYASPVNGSSGLLGFFRSEDTGVTWVDYGNSTNWLGGQGWYDNALIVSPLDPDFVLVGGIDIYRVTFSNGNMSVSKLTHWYSGAGYPYVHADQHFFKTIKVTGSNFGIIAANDGGIHYSADRGTNWTELNNNYNVTQYYDSDKHPADNAFIGGTQDNGTHRSPSNPTFSSSWTRVIGGDGFDCAWDKKNPNVVYGTLYSSRIYKSTDGGYDFSQINNGLPESGIFHTPLEMNPLRSDTLYTASGSNLLYYSFNAGDAWNSTSVNFGNSSRIKIGASLSNPDVIWTGSTTLYINISTDGGRTFSQVNRPAGSPLATLTGISTHPTDDATAFVTLGASGSGKIYRTNDLGGSWTNITGNLPDMPVFTVLVMPFDLNEIWIGTDIGLFISYDAGATWEYSDNGIPAVSIRRLKIIGQHIVATTHGRGIWSVFREELNAGPLLAPVLHDILVPNPNTNELKLKFQAASSYDSVDVMVGGQLSERLLNIQAGIDTFGIYLTNPPEEITARIYGYRDGLFEMSAEKTQSIYPAVETLAENFDDLNTTFFGQLIPENSAGFTTALLNSEHPYSHVTDHIGYLGTPITIKPGTVLSYDDVAIVEPGDPGSAYPDENFWDYVTVEGSRDGENWDVLITPYDAQYNATWLSTYNSSGAGDESMFQPHDIDLTTTYTQDENIYLRFRLHADQAANGWGWAIDNVEIDNIISGLAAPDLAVHSFNLMNNYPNPFNPTTIIRFTIAENGPVNLKIYNGLGQQVRTLLNNSLMNTGDIHTALWDGRNDAGQNVSSGAYYYKLASGNTQKVKKMILLR